MVAYLILIFGLIIIVTGITFSVTSDFVDSMLAATTYANTPLAGAMDADSIQTGDLLLVLFKYILIVILIALAYWMWVMSQKPVKSF